MEGNNHPHDDVQPLVDEVLAKQPQQPETVKADDVTITGNASSVEAREVHMTNGGIGALRGTDVTVTMQNGGIGAISASTVIVRTESGGVGAIAAREATVNDGNVGMVAALKLGGNVKVAFDLRAGLLAGAVFGVLVTAGNLLIRRGRR